MDVRELRVGDLVGMEIKATVVAIDDSMEGFPARVDLRVTFHDAKRNRHHKTLIGIPVDVLFPVEMPDGVPAAR